MARSWVRNVAGERFVWFLILGAGLFALHAYLDNPASNIRVSSADISMLTSRWQAQTGATPSAEELNSLVEYHVREEILAREARRLGLDTDDAILRRQIALIQSMTKLERANPQILQASRKKRIAKGAGLEVSELNKLLKMHRQMADMMKKMGKGGALKQAMKGMFGKGGGMPEGMDPSQMDPKALEKAAKQMGQMPGGMGGMGKGGLPGLGGGALPPGLSGFGKKK